MNKLRHLKTLLLMLLLPGYTAYCQGIAGKPAPSASGGLSKKGSDLVNVNLYTGQGVVTIPLYEYALENLDLGISLVYNAKGVKVDELSSSVGLGWDINIGAGIVREVRGIEDEVTTPARFKPPTPMYSQWNNLHDTLQGILSPGALDPHNPPVDTFKFPVYDDEEYDIFHASFGGRTIKFGFKRGSSGIECVTYPESKIKIDIITKELQSGSYIFTGQDAIVKYMGLDSIHNILTFIITDEYGNKFYFDRGDYQVKELELEPATFHNPNAVYYPTDNWVLTKIETFSGQQVLYHYVRKYVEYAESLKEILHGYNNPGFPIPKYPIEANETKFKGYKHHISRIDYPNGVSAIFDLESNTASGRCDCEGNYRLKNLVIESKLNNNNQHTQTFRFDQAYFNSPKYGLTTPEILLGVSCASIESSLDLSSLSGFSSTELDSVRKAHLSRGLRLKLKGIRRIGTDGVSSEDLYTFTYNQTALPYRFNASKDYYGYYNGGQVIPYYYYADAYDVDTFYFSIPMHNKLQFGYNQFEWQDTWGAERHYDFDNAQACVLTKIKNGSGREDSIIYINYHLDNPDCSYGDVDLFMIGCTIDPELWGDTENDGLVVGKVISRNGYTADATMVTEYSYLDGQRFYRGGYFSYKEPSTTDMSFTNFFTDRHDYYNGSNHGFGTVTVSRYGYNNIRLSKTMYTFSNLMYEVGSDVFSCMEKPTGIYLRTITPNLKKYRMGLLLGKDEYDEWDSLKYRETYTYQERILTDSILNVNRVKYPTAPPGPWGYVIDCWICGSSIWQNRLFDYRGMFPETITTTQYVYDPVTHLKDSLFNIRSHVYNANHKLKSVYWRDSKDDSYVKHIKYNSDYGSASSATTYMNQENFNHMLSTETYVYSTKQPPYVDSSLFDFDLKVPGLYYGWLRFPATYSFIGKNNATNTPDVDRTAALNLNADAGNNLLNTQYITRYDSKANVTEVKFNNIDVYNSNLWDISFGNKIAEVFNGRWEDIAFSSFEGAYAAVGLPDENKGNLEFERANIIFCDTSLLCPKAITGKHAFRMPASSGTSSSITTGLLHPKEYVITFWSTDNAGSILQVSLNNGTTNLGQITTTVLNTVGNWKLHFARFTAAQNDFIRIQNFPGFMSGTATYLDEIRLYPVGATMKTYCYKPLFGIGSVCDENNYITYYEYDVFGRQMQTRDMRGNVISKVETAVGNADQPSTSTPPNSTY